MTDPSTELDELDATYGGQPGADGAPLEEDYDHDPEPADDEDDSDDDAEGDGVGADEEDQPA